MKSPRIVTLLGVTMAVVIGAWPAAAFAAANDPDGHVGLPGYPLIFSTLARLPAGAELIVVHADGLRSHFTVSAIGSWPADSHPAGLFATGGPARLSLITCTGPYDRSNQTYADRLIVEATYTGSD